MIDRTKEGWWKQAVFYQVYPKSFQDTNGDGIGDIQGVVQHLDYLEKLGVDGIWLSPIFLSPQRDNGYDISDYRAVDPLFGTMDDVFEMIDEAKKRGIIVIMDLVVNHTSDEHPWFIEAKKSKDNPYHDFYIWRDGTPDAPPNDMQAEFGGPSWTYVPELGQYYYMNFSSYQPDLNWDNPKVRQALYDDLKFWVGKGVGGFRLDAIPYIGKDLEAGIRQGHPKLHAYLREMKEEIFRDPDLVLIGEATDATLEQAKIYSNPDGSELDMIFHFGMMIIDYGPGGSQNGRIKWNIIPLHLPALKEYYETWQQGLYHQGWNSLFTGNHDLPRVVSHWGNDKEWREVSAKMLGTLIHGMQGTPYIYQGEEIGMTNVELPIEAYDDLEIKTYYKNAIAAGRSEDEVLSSIYARGRDNARTPMQWTNGKNAGFSDVKPWLPVNPNYKEINAASDVDNADSVFCYYQKLIALRKEYPVFVEGSFSLLEPDNEQTFCYTRDTETEHMLVECNFTASEQPECCPNMFQEGEILLSNYADPHGPLRPYEARMVYVKD